MNHYGDVALGQSEHAGRLGVVHLIDHLHLEEVVAAAEGPALGPAPLKGAVGNEVGPRPRHAPTGLGELVIRIPPEAALQHVWRALFQQFPQLSALELDPSAPADPTGYGVEHPVDQTPQARPDLVERDVGADQSDPAVDVVPHAAGADHPALLGIGRGHPADAESVAPVDVGHGQ